MLHTISFHSASSVSPLFVRPVHPNRSYIHRHTETYTHNIHPKPHSSQQHTALAVNEYCVELLTHLISFFGLWSDLFREQLSPYLFFFFFCSNSVNLFPPFKTSFRLFSSLFYISFHFPASSFQLPASTLGLTGFLFFSFLFLPIYRSTQPISDFPTVLQQKVVYDVYVVGHTL